MSYIFSQWENGLHEFLTCSKLRLPVEYWHRWPSLEIKIWTTCNLYVIKEAKSGAYARLGASLREHPNHVFGNLRETMPLLRSRCCALSVVPIMDFYPIHSFTDRFPYGRNYPPLCITSNLQKWPTDVLWRSEKSWTYNKRIFPYFLGKIIPTPKPSINSEFFAYIFRMSSGCTS